MADEEDPILTLLREIIETNGHTPTAQKDKALFTVLTAIYTMVKPLPPRIKTLEDNSIVLWARNHKAETGAIVTIAAFVAMAFHDLYPYFLGMLAMIDPLK